MIRCLSCKHEELVGTIFCSECGAQLPQLAGDPVPTRINVGAVSGVADFETKYNTKHSRDQSEATVSLLVEDSNEKILLKDGVEFTLGRMSDNQPLIPDIDLSNYQAFDRGVSRLHATIRVESAEVTLIDLGSANGTLLNGRKVPPQQPQPLSDGDRITLGKFKLRILISRP